MTVFSNDQIADFLIHEDGEPGRRWETGTDRVISVNYSGLEPNAVPLVEAALQAWSDVTGLNFVHVQSDANINFDDEDNGAYASFSHYQSVNGNPGRMADADVNVSKTWVGLYGDELDTYSYQTYLHEIGHALGLGHSGHYNGSATYGVDNHFDNDSWQATVMSYFSQNENTTIDASYAFVVTPMIADVLAMWELYGNPANVRTSDTTYGVNSNAGGVYDQLLSFSAPVTFTIVDDGGIDTIDFSHDTLNQRVNLNDETYSDVLGLTGNMAIMRGSVIENYVAGSGDDDVTGNRADNHLQGMAGDDILRGGGGADVLDGGTGRDVLIGGTGNDVYILSDTEDTVIEGESEGEDTIGTTLQQVSLLDFENVENLYYLGQEGPTAGGFVGEGNDLNNLISGNEGSDFLYGGHGDDFLGGHGGTDALFGGTGRDYLQGGDGDDGLDGESGDDSLHGGAGVDWLYGRQGDDWLTGGSGGDALFGGAGNDELNGGAGNDSLDGGHGNDRLDGGAGVDWIYGGFGDDILHGANAGDDSTDTDALFGQEGDDVLYGGGGGDSLDGGADDDVLYGQDGVDWLFGQDGADRLEGGNDGDVLFGGAGADHLDGGAGGDSLDGGAGDDTLHGGAGVDVLFGGEGADTFLFTDKTHAEDVIRDFISGVDQVLIDLSGFGLSDALAFFSGDGLPAQIGDNTEPALYFETETKGLWLFDTSGGEETDQIKIVGLETGELTTDDIAFI